MSKAGDEVSRVNALENLLKELAVLFSRQHWTMSQELEEFGLTEGLSSKIYSNKWRKYENPLSPYFDDELFFFSLFFLFLWKDYETGKTL